MSLNRSVEMKTFPHSSKKNKGATSLEIIAPYVSVVNRFKPIIC